MQQAERPQRSGKHYSLLVLHVQASIYRLSNAAAVHGSWHGNNQDAICKLQEWWGAGLEAWRPVDGDVAPVPNLLGEVGRIEDVLRLEERVLPVLSQEPKVQSQSEVGHGLVQESGMARLIS